MSYCISSRTAPAAALERCGSASALLSHYSIDGCNECARKGSREEGEFVKDFWHGSLNTGVVLGDSCRILPTQGISRTGHPNKKWQRAQGEKLQAAPCSISVLSSASLRVSLTSCIGSAKPHRLCSFSWFSSSTVRRRAWQPVMPTQQSPSLSLHPTIRGTPRATLPQPPLMGSQRSARTVPTMSFSRRLLLGPRR